MNKYLPFLQGPRRGKKNINRWLVVDNCCLMLGLGRRLKLIVFRFELRKKLIEHSDNHGQCLSWTGQLDVFVLNSAKDKSITEPVWNWNFSKQN